MTACASAPEETTFPDETTEVSSKRVKLPVVLHFAHEDGSEVVDAGRVGMWLAQTQALLRPHGVDVELVDVRTLPSHASADGIMGRYRLLRQVDTDAALHVMVVEGLGGMRRDGKTTVRGLHFRALVPRSQYIAVGPDATPSTMAHEVGHAFGLDHKNDPNNIMCSCERTDSPGLTVEQGARIQGEIRRSLYGE